MSSRWLLVITLLSAAACQSTLSTPPAETTQSIQEAESATATAEHAWVEVSSNGVRLRIQVPPGWSVYTSEHGILLAEHSGSVAGGGTLDGIVLNMFVQPTQRPSQTPQAAQDNLAWVTLKEVTELPHEYGLSNAVTTEPVALDWDGHDAAYYLVNDGNGNLTLLLAVALARTDRIVVLNFSAPADLAPRIRWMLPTLLSTLEINGTTLSVEALDSLPRHLPYPQYEPPKDTPSRPPH